MALMARKNKNPSAKYAFIGLIVALLGCISTTLIGAAKVLAPAINAIGLENQASVDLAFQISIGLTVVALLAYVIMTPDSVRRFLSGRQARYGSNSLIMSLAFIGILIVANMLAYQNPKTLLDMTQDKSNTLANESLQALVTLPEKVTAIAFFSGNLDRSSAEELLSKFKENSKGKFDYDFVDPDQDPLTARTAGITGDGKILLTMGDKREIASFVSETELTRALIRLISPEARTVYFLQGHGEPSLEPGGELSYSVAKSRLESKNYTVSPLFLSSENRVPDDALSIIIAGPEKPLSSSEVSLLKKYVDAGGSLVVMENPIILTEFGDSYDPLAAYLEKDWGIVLNNDIIFDLTSQQPLIAQSAVADTTHPITQNLRFNYQINMPQARSVGVAETAPENVTLTPLIFTSVDSWGETQLSDDPNAQYQADLGIDFIGPLNMAVAGENSATTGRVVVLGNSFFIVDDFFDVYGNGNFFINSVDWAAEQEDLINITPRESIARSFNPPTLGGFIIIVIFVVLVLPGLVVFLGVSSWITRRRRG
jgi:ABC-type uncharacterized transport system involved in gliding motility auxiliary subunit